MGKCFLCWWAFIDEVQRLERDGVERNKKIDIILSLNWFYSYRQPWLIRGMAAGTAAEAVETSEIPITKSTEDDDVSLEVIPKYLIGKTQEELEEIVLSFGEVSFCDILFYGRFSRFFHMAVESMRQEL